MVFVITPPPRRPWPTRNPARPTIKTAHSPPRQLALQRALLEQLSASRAELREERERGRHRQAEAALGRCGRDSHSRVTPRREGDAPQCHQPCINPQCRNGRAVEECYARRVDRR